MLTDQQIEAAARKLCELRKLDPDIVAWKPSNAPHLTYWQMASEEVRNADQVREAIASVDDSRPGYEMTLTSHIGPIPTGRFVFKTAPEPPPGPCECGHSTASHHFHGMGWIFCRECPCTGYKAELPVP